MNVDVRFRSRPANLDSPAGTAPAIVSIPSQDPETPPSAERISQTGSARNSHSGGNFLLDIAASPTPLPRDYCQPGGHDVKMGYAIQRLWRTATQRQHLNRLLLGTFITVFLFYIVAVRPVHRPHRGASRSLMQALEKRMGANPPEHRDCLVAYVFQDFDAEALTNLRYFVDNGMAAEDRCEYVVVVQRATNQTELSWLPGLPTNARYVFNPFYMQDCNDWGIFGWLMTSGHIKPVQHQYFFFLNSGIRGPFFPAYLKGQIHWTTPFISKIRDNVKLVGPSLRCVSQLCKTEEEPEGVTRVGPAIQNLWAVDQVGLKVLLDEGSVFTCHHEPEQALCRSELGASLAMIESGYNVDTLMLRYQGVDWTSKATWGCNSKMDPLTEHQYDGVTVDPLETMFVKMDQDAVESEAYYAMKALKYQLWDAALKKKNPALLEDNEFTHPGLNKFKAWKVIEMWGRGQDCFDFKYYFEENSDVRVLQVKEAWKHFLLNGQFEGRRFRFKCNADADSARVQLVKATGIDINM